MEHGSILTDDFDEVFAAACRNARASALAEGHAVVFAGPDGRYLKEFPDGRVFEIRFDPKATGEAHCVLLGEVSPVAA